mgnify:CR=1 FL=1
MFKQLNPILPVKEILKEINGLADEMAGLSNLELKNKTQEFKERLAQGESLDDLLPEAFAVVREADKRVLGMFPYDVQVMGGIVMHQGHIAEMNTGEGKTLTATMPVYLNALSGEGAILVTTNEYLAIRDAEEMGQVYEFLGLTIGVPCVEDSNEMEPAEKRAIYQSDIVYTTNASLGFDYLIDNLASNQDGKYMRPFNYAIVDEVDSVLLDSAQTPLIISGAPRVQSNYYGMMDTLMTTLVEGEDYIFKEEKGEVWLTTKGAKAAENYLGIGNLYDEENSTFARHLLFSLRAHLLYKKDKDYIIRDGKKGPEVVLLDKSTGRLLELTKLQGGLHQAIEAKELVALSQETRAMASITYQSLFKKFKKISGMTGTGKTEEDEFREIYNMRIIPIPTNRPIQRIDHDDLLYPTLDAKFRAVVQDVKRRYEKGQPVLVGTVAVETSDLISKMLVEAGIPHEVLNAKNHEKEAHIIMNAGQRGAVTIATNMAGRGTDIKLGEGVLDLGGLCVIGTERHESRRIDNQLRGRAGRQGDPGESQFYLSLEDELMRRFGSDRIKQVLERLNADDEDIVIKSRMLTRQVEAAQKRVEGNNYDTRKQVLQYDDVMREQREIIYAERYDVITAERDLEPEIKAMIKRTINRTVDGHSRNDQEEALKGILNFARQALVPENAISLEDLREVGEVTKRSVNYDAIKVYLNELADDVYARQIKKLRSEEAIREFQKVLILMVVDNKWTDHIDALDQLRNAVGLRGYAQNNPIVEYQSEGFKMFQDMIGAIEYDVTRTMMKAQIHEQSRENVNERVSTTATGNIQAHQADANGQEIDFSKVGRNDFCPCGSGKKFKNCHGRKQF